MNPDDFSSLLETVYENLPPLQLAGEVVMAIGIFCGKTGMHPKEFLEVLSEALSDTLRHYPEGIFEMEKSLRDLMATETITVDDIVSPN